VNESPVKEPLNKKVSLKRIFFEVTPFSKYAALMMFVMAPFVGALVAYKLAPEKILTIQEPVFINKIIEADNQGLSTIQVELPSAYSFYLDKETGLSFYYPEILTLSHEENGQISLELERYQKYRVESVPKDCGIAPLPDELFMVIVDESLSEAQIELLPEIQVGHAKFRREFSKGEMCYLTTTYYWQKPDLTYVTIYVSPEESIFREIAEEIISSFEYIDE
jgi:hypothetical protein